MSHNSILKVNDGVLPPDVPLIFEGNSGSGSAINNIFHIVGAGGVSTNVVMDTLTITVTTTGFTWNTVTSVSPTNPIQLVAENGYICNGTSMVTFILPLAPNIGDTFIILSNTATFRITENASQQICIGPVSSTAGSGNATSNALGDMIEFVYVGLNSGIAQFRAFAPQGVISLN